MPSTIPEEIPSDPVLYGVQDADGVMQGFNLMDDGGTFLPVATFLTELEALYFIRDYILEDEASDPPVPSPAMLLERTGCKVVPLRILVAQEM